MVYILRYVLPEAPAYPLKEYLSLSLFKPKRTQYVKVVSCCTNMFRNNLGLSLIVRKMYSLYQI